MNHVEIMAKSSRNHKEGTNPARNIIDAVVNDQIIEESTIEITGLYHFGRIHFIVFYVLCELYKCLEKINILRRAK